MKLSECSDEQQRFLRERAKPLIAAQPGLLVLRDRLLDLGGKEVVFFCPESDLSALLARGRSFPAARSRRRRMERSHCHGNVARLYFESRGRIRIATGYALSEDRLWRQHSWGVEGETVIETTEPRVAYFGIELTVVKAALFALSNAA
jgi:hypothetical protein